MITMKNVIDKEVIIDAIFYACTRDKRAKHGDEDRIPKIIIPIDKIEYLERESIYMNFHLHNNVIQVQISDFHTAQGVEQYLNEIINDYYKTKNQINLIS